MPYGICLLRHILCAGLVSMGKGIIYIIKIDSYIIYIYGPRSAGPTPPPVCCFRDAMYPEAYMSLELHDAHEFA